MKNTASTPSEIPKSLKGFQHVKKIWDPSENIFRIIVNPGQFYVTKTNEAIMTTLGSCISACIRDPQAKVGGINHFMLPPPCTGENDDTPSLVSGAARYGNWAMEFLINEILKNGGKRRNLEIKLFGGGDILNIDSKIGKSNIEFTQNYLHDENLNAVVCDVGGSWARIILYYPWTGKAKVKHLTEASGVSAEELSYIKQVKSSNQKPGDIELF